MGALSDWLHCKLTGEVRTERIVGYRENQVQDLLREEVRRVLRRPLMCPHGFAFAITNVTVQWGRGFSLTGSPSAVCRFECCHDERAGTFFVWDTAKMEYRTVVERPSISPDDVKEMREEDGRVAQMFAEARRDLDRRVKQRSLYEDK